MNRGAIVALAFASLVLAACDDGAAVLLQGEPVRPVRLETVGPVDELESRRFVGRVDAVSTVDLSFQVAGRIVEIPVQQGAIVPKGGLIAALDPTDFELALRQAEAQKELAEKDLHRKQQLIGNKTVSQAVFDQAETEFRVRSVAVDNARRNLSFARIEAPFDALVTRRLVDPFTNVQPHANIVRVQDITELRVHFNVPESLVLVSQGRDRFKVEAEFPNSGGRRFALEYREHATQPDAVAQTYQVTYGMPRTDDLNILPGMTVTVIASPREDKPQTVLSVPVSALGTDEKGRFRAWVYDATSGTVRARPVDVGPIANHRVPVLSGLSRGETIVTAGVHLLRDGMAVRPLTAD